jgi:predicted PhzF superfamily epimerase YddE/YHI9
MFIERIDYRATERDSQRQSAVLMTKAGPIPIFFNPYRQVAACSVPYNIHIHKSRVSFDDVLAVQPQVKIVPAMERVKDKSYPIVSIVNGMTFCLVDLTDAPEVLTALRAGEAPVMTLDEEWNSGFCGAIYYERRGEDKASEPTIYNMHVRMITQGIEDPGTGSGNCALACYLALAADETSPKQEVESASSGEDLALKTGKIKLGDKTDHHVFAIEQGLEMGRKCTIAIEVDIKDNEDGKRAVAGLILSGRCMFFSRGEIMGVY